MADRLQLDERRLARLEPTSLGHGSNAPLATASPTGFLYMAKLTAGTRIQVVGL